MAIRIGHAAIGTDNKAHGDAAGDQTGKEVCIRSWYNKPWTVVLRPKDAAVAEAMAQAMEAACGNENIGYDQYSRNTLNTQAKKVGYDLAKITAKCECDCSSLVAVCAQAAGVNIPYTNGNAPTTRTLQKVFVGTGAFTALTDSKYLSSDKYLKRGDVLVKPGSHTAMALDNGEYEQPKVEDKPAGVIGVGSVVTFKSDATNYYPGGPKISETAARPYCHVVTQTETKAGKTVTKGGAVCVLLGRKIKTLGGGEVSGINTWVALDVLELVSGGIVEEPEDPGTQEEAQPAAGTIEVGSVVKFKADAATYYPGGAKISETAARPYYHIVTQDKSKGKQVVKGGKVCVLLGQKKKPGSGTAQAGIKTWVAVDNLALV